MSAFADLASDPRWIAWRNERRGERLTKVPYGVGGRPAKADDPATWLGRSDAEQLHRRLANGTLSGVGLELGPCGADVGIGGVDLDTCRIPDGTLASWAQEIIDRFASYAEVSPSQHEVKVFFYYPASELDSLRAALGDRDGRKFSTNSRGDHPPAIELYLNRRYFAVTEQHLPSTPDRLQMLPIEDLLWLIEVAGPAFAPPAAAAAASAGRDGSRSAIAMKKGAALRRAGKTFEEMCDALRHDPETADWVREKGEAAGGRELRRIWERGAQSADNASQREPLAPLDVINFPDLEKKTVPQQEWLVPWWIPWGRVTGLYGAGGEGKTLLVQQLMTCAALGKDWLGLPVRPVRSVGIFCEDDADEVHRRQAEINELYDCQFADLAGMHIIPRLGYDNLLMTFDNNGRARLTDYFWQLVEAAKGWQAQLFVIDTVADTFGGNEIDRAQVRQFVQMALGGFARQINGVTVALAHPSRGGIEQGYSGSTGWEFTMRSKLNLTRPKADDDEQIDPNTRVLVRNKANYGPRDEQINLIWKTGVFQHQPPPGGMFRTVDRNHADRVFMELLDRFTAEGRYVSESPSAGNYAPRAFAKRPDAEGYKRGDFSAAMERLFHRRQIKKTIVRGSNRHDYATIVRQENVVDIHA